jgi:hypothetical protein
MAREIAQRPEFGVTREVFPFAQQLREVQRPGFRALAGARFVELADVRLRTLVRGVPVLALVLLSQCEGSLGDLRGRRLRDHVLGEPGDHPALGHRPVCPVESESAGPDDFECECRERITGSLRPVPAARVDRPPLAGADGLDLVLPDADRFAYLLYRRLVPARAALGRDRRAVGGADRLERVSRVVPSGDADDDHYRHLLSVISAICDLELDRP